MRQYCEFCGSVLENGQCTNRTCAVNVRSREEMNGAPKLKKPISLQERRMQMFGTGYRRIAVADESMGENSVTKKDPIYEQQTSVKNEHSEKETTRQEGNDQRQVLSSVTTSGREETGSKETGSKETESKEVYKRQFYDQDAQQEERMEEGRRDPDQMRVDTAKQFSYFLSDYYREPGKVVSAAARKRDVAKGVLLILVSVCLSSAGTLLFGVTYLENFFSRWVVSGFAMPILAYGLSLLYGKLYVSLDSVKAIRGQSINYNPVSFRELFTVVTVASAFPNLILLLSCVLSPMDKSLETFQFFALLLTFAWILCLVLTLFSVYGGGLTLGSLLLTVCFGFFAFVIMRTVWVWYLTGEFTFALYIPLSVFLTGH